MYRIKKAALFVFVQIIFLHSVFAQKSSFTTRQVSMGERFTVDVSHDGKERQFPFVYKFGKNIFVSYSEHKDAVLASPVDAMMISRDNGKTWKEKITNPDFYITSMVEKNGTLYGVVYFTYPESPDKEKMVYWTSKDMGKTWTKHEGVVYAPEGRHFAVHRKVWSSMLFHRGMQVMEDGSIQGLMYGYFDGEEKYTSVWVRSDDNCASWKMSSIVATGPKIDTFSRAQGYCEPTFAQVKDGSILCVMRIGSYLPLFQCRSYDKGRTWSKPEALPGLSMEASQSVDAHLLLMKNGILALTYGRPHDRIAFSRDGSGYKWDGSLITYDGETTGYSGIVETAPGKLLQIADQGRTGAKEMAIWGRFIKVKMKKTVK